MVECTLQDLPHGIRLSCRATGTRGRPVLMFLHGFPEAAFVWDDLLLHFARPEHGGYRCVAPNLRGYADSSSPADVEAYRVKHLVRDIAALIVAEGAPLACLVAHDWGGALAWSLASQRPELARRLAIVNSPHPGTFLRELKGNAEQQAASAYMNFLVRPDAEALLAADGYRRLFAFFDTPGRSGGAPAWLTEPLRERYRAVWGTQGTGLRGPCNYYRASPLRPPQPDDPAAAAVELPAAMLNVTLPTLVLWAMQDQALPPALLDGLDAWVPALALHRIEDATHWILHENPGLVAAHLGRFLAADRAAPDAAPQ